MSETGENLKKCILAVDDDVIILTRISSILRNDYELVTINSAVSGTGEAGSDSIGYSYGSDGRH